MGSSEKANGKGQFPGNMHDLVIFFQSVSVMVLLSMLTFLISFFASVKVTVGRKVMPRASNAKTHLSRNRVSDGFMIM